MLFSDVFAAGPGRRWTTNYGRSVLVLLFFLLTLLVYLEETVQYLILIYIEVQITSSPHPHKSVTMKKKASLQRMQMITAYLWMYFTYQTYLCV